MELAFYIGDRVTSSIPRHHPQNRRRHAPVWDRIRREIEIERRMLIFTDPYSPRIRPTLAPVGWGLR
jgi:hypothetical protein